MPELLDRAGLTWEQELMGTFQETAARIYTTDQSREEARGTNAQKTLDDYLRETFGDELPLDISEISPEAIQEFGRISMAATLARKKIEIGNLDITGLQHRHFNIIDQHYLGSEVVVHALPESENVIRAIGSVISGSCDHRWWDVSQAQGRIRLSPLDTPRVMTLDATGRQRKGLRRIEVFEVTMVDPRGNPLVEIERVGRR